MKLMTPFLCTVMAHGACGVEIGSASRLPQINVTQQRNGVRHLDDADQFMDVRMSIERVSGQIRHEHEGLLRDALATAILRLASTEYEKPRDARPDTDRFAAAIVATIFAAVGQDARDPELGQKLGRVVKVLDRSWLDRPSEIRQKLKVQIRDQLSRLSWRPHVRYNGYYFLRRNRRWTNAQIELVRDALKQGNCAHHIAPQQMHPVIID